jgi:tetratricopeptide (TPR) repeat protein
MLKRLVSAFVVAVTLSGVAMAGSWEDGVAAYQRSDYATALRLWQPLAEAGDPRAENNLGLLYEKGLGVAANYEIVADWYRKAAAQGHAGAQKNLADLVANGLVAAGSQLSPPVAAAGQPTDDLVLSGNDRWVQVASRQDLNEAISIAETYAAQKSRVVKAQNGWYAVVLGPYATNDIVSLQRDNKWPTLPTDSKLTRGTAYVETVWQPPSGVPGPSVAGTSPDWPACAQEEDRDASIRASTRIIDAGTETSENLAIAHTNRGIGYNRNGDHDLAIADFDKAIQIQPNCPPSAPVAQV